jgi:hypothetical protein
MKAMVRFSVAVLGCPVEAASAGVIARERVGETQVFLLPADGRAGLDLAAIGAGAFTLHVFTPGSATPCRFGPVPIRAGDRFQLRLNRASVALRNTDSAPGHRLTNYETLSQEG